jgi:hypothetical protein
MSGHTPGPWGLDTLKTSCGICHKIGPFPYKPDRQCHACVYVDYPGDGAIERELLANARLIAASPDLLEALQNLIAAVEEPDSDSLMELIQARAAIRKATGES